MNKLYVVLAGLVAAVAPMALADHCEEPFLDRDSHEATIYEDNSIWIRNVNDEPEGLKAVYYIDNDPCQLDLCGYSIWIYEETNTYDNLQRGDKAPDDDEEYLHDDTCHGMIKPDAIVF